MKKLNKISLHNLSQAELAKREANLLRGGEYTCTCAGGAVCECENTGTSNGSLDYYTNPVTISTENSNFNLHVTNINNMANYPMPGF